MILNNPTVLNNKLICHIRVLQHGAISHRTQQNIAGSVDISINDQITFRTMKLFLLLDLLFR